MRKILDLSLLPSLFLSRSHSLAIILNCASLVTRIESGESRGIQNTVSESKRIIKQAARRRAGLVEIYFPGGKNRDKPRNSHGHLELMRDLELNSARICAQFA